MRFNRRHFVLATGSLPVLFPHQTFAQTPAPSATPESGRAIGRMESLLSFLPGGVLDERLDIAWVDLESQVAAYSDASVPDDERMTIVYQSAFGYLPPIFSYSELLGDEIGFTTVDLRQVLSAGLPPNITQIIELGIHVAELTSAWESAGYQKLENEYGEFWSLNETAEVDLNNPIQRVALAHFNNLAILNETTLAAATTADNLGLIMAAASGEAPNKAGELEPISAGIPSNAVSAWYIDGGVLNFDVPDGDTAQTRQQQEMLEDLIAESDTAVGEMPVIRTLCTGSTAGASRDESLHLEDSVAWMVLQTDQPGQAEQAGNVVQWRLQNLTSLVNGEPLSEFVGPVTIETIDGENVRISASGDAAMRSIFSQMILRYDILAFVYHGDPSD